MNCSLYIHIPFCVRKCRYCDFYSRPYDRGAADRSIGSLRVEWERAAERFGLADVRFDTVYIGGGTPSALSIGQWDRLQRELFEPMGLDRAREWTIECNPESFSRAKAARWRACGVTRLSLGIQSLDDRELRVLGRPHGSRAARELLSDPLLETFQSVNIDIMYGIPGQSPASLSATMRDALAYPAVRHLSCYELTIAANTPFCRHRAMLPLPDEHTLEALQRIIERETRRRGFEHYEISNYARSGHRCRHNLAYWTHQPYLGLGPAAHSFVHMRRHGAPADLEAWHNALRGEGLPIAHSERIAGRTLAHELIFLRLRLRDGLDETEFARMTGESFYDNQRRKPALDMLLAQGMIRRDAGRWILTRRGFLAADGVARMLLHAGA
jgi:oxygen-independent coproporphyrinogen-3 oxidase